MRSDQPGSKGVGVGPLAELLSDVWRSVLVEGRSVVEIAGVSFRVERTKAQRLRTVTFPFEGHMIDAIEQNPNKASRWAELAREGKRIVQFKCRGRFFANVCEGTLLRYPAWAALGLPP